MKICASRGRTAASDHVSSCVPNLIPNVEAAFNFTHFLWHIGSGSGLHFIHTFLPSEQPNFHPGIHSLLSEWTGGASGGGRIASLELNFNYPSPTKPYFMTREDLQAVSTFVHSRKTSVRCGHDQIDKLLRLLTDPTPPNKASTLGTVAVEACAFTMADLCTVVSSLCACRTNAPWRLFTEGVEFSFRTSYPTMQPNATCPLIELAEPSTPTAKYTSGNGGRLVYLNTQLGLRFLARVIKSQSWGSDGHTVGVRGMKLTFDH